MLFGGRLGAMVRDPHPTGEPWVISLGRIFQLKLKVIDICIPRELSTVGGVPGPLIYCKDFSNQPPNFGYSSNVSLIDGDTSDPEPSHLELPFCTKR